MFPAMPTRRAAPAFRRLRLARSWFYPGAVHSFIDRGAPIRFEHMSRPAFEFSNH
jgi:hypothetical protein